MKVRWYHLLLCFVFFLVYGFVVTKGESLVELFFYSVILTLFIALIIWIKQRNEKK